MESSSRESRIPDSKENLLTCKPLKTYVDLLLCTANLPSWRSLCEEITPHSKKKVKNMDYAGIVPDLIRLEDPFPFCHITNEHEVDVRREESTNLPKTLVCHDFANGYHDDSHIHGTDNFEAYSFYHWPAIDIFCYFSHNLITIPPVGWINVGHMHGVKVIGTLITERKEGIVFWEQMLSSEEEWRNLASMLVGVAKMLKFDGWLLNIENKVDAPDSLLRFVRFLHSLLHAEIRNAVLIWYDSVTIHGKLSWQNALNKKNKPFFDVCDGIFTNYSWTPADVEASAEVAGGRRFDVYIGIDVWGRNFFGGGMFNCQEAVAVAHTYGCSLAIFAPAWTYEALSADSKNTAIAMADDMSFYDMFLLRDRALWDSIWPYLNINLPCVLPFTTSFCRGQGQKRWLYGEVVQREPWFNLRSMQYQPNSNHGPHGYIMSTAEKIAHAVSDKSANGILRLRESFIAQNKLRMQELAAKESRDESEDEELPQSSKSVTVSEPDSIEPDSIEPDSIEPDSIETVYQPNTLKFRVRSFLKNLFAKKAVAAPPPPASVSEPELETMNMRSTLRVSKKSLHAEKVSVNLNLGERKRMRYELGFVASEEACLAPYWGDAFMGGGCLQVCPGVGRSRSTMGATVRLLHCDLPLDPGVVVCVVTKTLPEHPDQSLQVTLVLRDAKNFRSSVTLVGRSPPTRVMPGVRLIHAVNYPKDSQAFQDLQKYLMHEEPGFYISPENNFGWDIRYYVYEKPGNRITSINLRTEIDMNPILLGYIGFCRKGPPKPKRISAPPSSVSIAQFR